MRREILYTDNLTDFQIKSIYFLHKQFYVKRDIGFNYNKWKENLLKSYHGVCRKQIQISIDSLSNIVGYTIFTEPMKINGTNWSKILEGGFFSENSKIEFVDMITDIANDKDVNYFGEVSINARLVLYLMKKSGFNQISSNDMNKIFDYFLGEKSYKLINDNGTIVINRKTGLTNNYWGNVVIKINVATSNANKEHLLIKESVF